MKQMLTTQIKKPRIGVVLSSGGVRGVYAHTGFLLALEKMKIEIKAMAGCSAGAVVGGVYASGTGINEWSDALKKIKPKQFWSPSLLRFLVSFILQKGRGYIGMSSVKFALNFCRSHLKAKNFEDCEIPFYTLAKNLLYDRKVVFHHGELAPRIVASAAAPLMYEPVEIDNELYCDGALLELSPTDAICCKHQLDILIIHHVAKGGKGTLKKQQLLKQSWSMIEILNLLLYQQRPWYLSDSPIAFRRCPCGCDAIIIVIEPELPELLWSATKNGEQVLQQAKQQAEEVLKPYLDAIKNNNAALQGEVEDLEASVIHGCGVKYEN